MPRFLENSPNIQSFEKFPKSERLYHPQIPKGIWGISQMPGYLGISQMSILIKNVNAVVSWHQQDTLPRCENRNAENRWFILSIFLYTILKLIYQKAIGFLRLFSSLPYLINNMCDIYLYLYICIFYIWCTMKNTRNPYWMVSMSSYFQ